MSGAFIKMKALIVDNDIQARMRLKQATASVATFGEVKLLGTLDETIRHLGGSGHVDIAFITNRFEQATINSFIKEAKETAGGLDTAYVLVLKTDDQDSNTVAQNVLGGADGFLLEPYSVDNLVEIAELAARVKRERSQEREAAALTFLVKDVVRQVDRVAYIKSCGFDVGRNMRNLREMCTVFNSLDPESKEIYYEVAIQAFGNAPIPNFAKKSYKGVSDRVKKKMEAKIIAQMEAEMEADAAATAAATSGKAKSEEATEAASPAE